MARRRRNDVQRARLRRQPAETRPWSGFRSRLHRRPRLVSGRLPASVDDLKGHAELFDGKITGIESGAGETEIVKNELIPDYGFEDEYTLQTSSSPAMLAALAKAIDHQKPIVVTLWHPHWAYNKFDIKDLKDPKGAMGEPEKLHIMASEAFVADNPDLVAKPKDFSMDDDTFSGLMDVIDEDPDHPADAVDSWVQEHQDFVDELM